MFNEFHWSVLTVPTCSLKVNLVTELVIDLQKHYPCLFRYVSTFKEMIHQGSELKRKKRINPYPKRTEKPHYRDLVRQNEWLRQNVFDSLGNYLYC